jgi:ankyrin repeat protein
MSQTFFKLIQSGAPTEVAAAIETDRALASWRDANGVSALLWSVYFGKSPVREILLARLAADGVALDIFEAAAIGDAARLGAILDADPGLAQAAAGDGWTALHLAAAFGASAAVALLIERGARVDAVSENPQQNQPLHAALALGRNPETITLLLENGADPDAMQTGGYTAIFSAAAANRRDLAELLIAHGADPGLESENATTPGEFARERGHAELADWLDDQAEQFEARGARGAVAADSLPDA